MSPIPTIIIGRTPKIASKVREGLLPEYDVIHVILSMEQGMKDLPVLLSNPSKTPEHTEGNLGSGKYGTRPLVVGVGGGFDDEMFEKMRDACEGCDEGVVWVRVDKSKMEGMPSFSDADAYGTETAKRMKKKLNELQIGSGEAGKNQGVYFFP